jgi:hypothetical protein
VLLPSGSASMPLIDPWWPSGTNYNSETTISLPSKLPFDINLSPIHKLGYELGSSLSNLGSPVLIMEFEEDIKCLGPIDLQLLELRADQVIDSNFISSL